MNLLFSSYPPSFRVLRIVGFVGRAIVKSLRIPPDAHRSGRARDSCCLVEAYWGEVINVTPEFLTTTESDNKKLLDFLEEFGIDAGDEKPQWLLTAFYG